MNKIVFLLINKVNSVSNKWKKLQRMYDKEKIMLTAAEYKLPLNINNEYSSVTKNTYLGKNVNFNGMRIFGQGVVRIGDNFHSGYGCTILTENHNYKTATKIPYDETLEIKNVNIGDNVWLGNNVTILPGTILGEGVIVQNGSVVFGNIEKLSIIGGHPAKVFGKRNTEHYYSLKKEGRFH